MPQRKRLAAVVLAGSLLPVAAIADSVYLKNGQSFEGVEAVVTGDTVQIELVIGKLRLPMLAASATAAFAQSLARITRSQRY